MSLADDLRHELGAVDTRDRIQTMLLAVGMIAYGVALGVKWAAVETVNRLEWYRQLGGPALEMAAVWNHHILVTLAVAALAIGAAVGLELWGDGDE